MSARAGLSAGSAADLRGESPRGGDRCGVAGPKLRLPREAGCLQGKLVSGWFWSRDEGQLALQSSPVVFLLRQDNL